MKNIYKITFICFFVFVLLGCSINSSDSTSYNRDDKSGSVLISSMEEINSKMEKKDDFIVLFDLTYCSACENVYEMLSNYLQNHNVNILQLSIDTAFSNSKEAEDKLKKYFPDVKSAPMLYYIKGGSIEDEFKYNSDDLETKFDKWIQKHKLDALK